MDHIESNWRHACQTCNRWSSTFDRRREKIQVDVFKFVACTPLGVFVACSRTGHLSTNHNSSNWLILFFRLEWKETISYRVFLLPPVTFVYSGFFESNPITVRREWCQFSLHRTIYSSPWPDLSVVGLVHVGNEPQSLVIWSSLSEPLG